MSISTQKTGGLPPSAKWGDGINAGFQILPDVLLKNQNALNLTPVELIVLINITMHWWYEDIKPFPRTTTIAKRMGVTSRTVQRAMQRLQALGLIKLEKGKEQTVFDLSGLVKKLQQYAKSDPGYKKTAFFRRG